MVSLRQSAFSGGILGPQLLGRADLQKYQSGLRECRNMIVTRNGSLENRPGTMFVGEVKNSSNAVRLVKFVATSGQGLLLEFGANYIRFWKNGAAINHSASLGAWSSFVSYSTGQVVTYLGVDYLSLEIGNLAQQPDISPNSWYAQTSAVLELPTPIGQGALATMQFAQINDTMYLVQQSFYPQVLIRTSDTQWTCRNFVASTGIVAPSGVFATAGFPSTTVAIPTGVAAVGGGIDPITGSPNAYYVVTAFTPFNPPPLAESSTSSEVTSGFPTTGSPVTVSWLRVAGAGGYAVYRSIDSGGPYGIVAVTSALSFVDSAIETEAIPGIAVKSAPTSLGGATTFTYVVTAVSAVTGVESLASTPASCVGSAPNSAHPNVITWAPVTGAGSYRIYKSVSGTFEYIGTSFSTSFNDINIVPASSQQPPVNIPLFATSNDYPAVVGSYQQRLLFANTINQPQTVWASVVGSYTTFTTTLPVLDSGAIQFTIAGRVRQFVHALVDIGKLVIHTSAGEYIAYGNQFNALTPTTINLVQNGYAGSLLLVPVSIGSISLFVQARGNILRDLQYSIYSTTFAGKDTTLYAPNLFENQTITQMDWQQIYDSIIWVVQSNGAFLGLTYSKDQEMWAWHRHDTSGGTVEQVCVVQEGPSDIVYLVVKRTINGSVKRYIERMVPRQFVDSVMLTDAIFTDCSLTYDGRNTTSHTITATTSAGWTPQDNLTLTASASTFVSGDVGNDIVFQQLDANGLVTDSVTFSIIAYTSTTVVTAQASKPVPTWAQSVALTTWGKAVHHFSGISHLEARAITAQGDGAVVFNAITDATPTVVTSGAFTTPKNYMVLTAGLPITAQVQTLPVEGGGRTETMGNKQQLVNEVTVTLYNSRGGYYGQDFNHLYPWKQRGLQFEPMGSLPALFTGPTIIPIQGTWQTTGQVCIQQTDPLPLAISAIIPTVHSGN